MSGRRSGRPAAPRFNFDLAASRRLIDRAAARGSAMAGTIAARYSREDREAFALLLTPFLILAAVIATSVGMRLERAVAPMLAGRDPPVAARPHLPPLPGTAIRPVAPTMVIREALGAPDQVHRPTSATGVSEVPSAAVAGLVRPNADSATEIRQAASPETATFAAVAAAPRLGELAAVEPVMAGPAPVEYALQAPAKDTPAAAIAAQQIAMLDPSVVMTRPAGSGGPPLVVARPEADVADDARCSVAAASAGRQNMVAGFNSVRAIDGEAFGRLLSAAVLRQLDQFTIYNDAYRRISYPMGDVAELYGVCTDVIIRAYRDLGVDLQVAVHKARVGSGDTNIDHRRTETLRRFFQRAGQSLPVSTFAEDYAPGDIVTYDRPQNSGSRSHIAVVTDVIGPSGAPMIVHNRGWGAQLEDALFVDRITGHYRYAPTAGAPLLAGTRTPTPPIATPERLSQPVLRPAKSRRPEGGKPARQAERLRLPTAAVRNAQSAAAVTQANMMGAAIRR